MESPETPQPNIESVWNDQYPIIMKKCMEIYQEFGKFVEFGRSAFSKISGLSKHPVYKWVFDWIDDFAAFLTNSPLATSISKWFPNTEQKLLPWFALERAFALPGTSLNRGLLLEIFSPPCVRFGDGKTWILSRFYRNEFLSALAKDNKMRIRDCERSLTSDEMISRDCIDIQSRWEKFVKAYRGY